MTKSIHKILIGIVIFILISMNITLLFTTFKVKNLMLDSEDDKIDLISQIERYKNHSIMNINSFCLTKKSILSSNGILENTISQNKEIYVTIIPPNACNACVTSLFTEVINSGIDVDKLFLLVDLNSNLLVKEWLSFGFKKSNYIEDNLDLIKNCKLNKAPVFVKLSCKNENCIFLNYEPGISISAKKFIELNHNKI
jgi:hypothetical protein